MTLFTAWLKAALALALLALLPMAALRARPYDDRAGRALAPANCAPPCFMGLRPGIHMMHEAVWRLAAHEWVASRFENFPSQVRSAISFGAGVPRTLVRWRWSAARPDWIREMPGVLTLEDRAFLTITVDTGLTLGEIFLAFGRPDREEFVPTGSRQRRRFEYAAWYARLGLLVTAEGACPARGYYGLPVSAAFRRDAPSLARGVPEAQVCR